MKENEADTRKFRHDINNHIIVLQRLLKEEKYDMALSYLCEISDNVKLLNSEIRTGNDIVDAIVHEKYDKAQEYGIKFEVRGMFSAKLIISDYDICTILGNALDNAIEACQKVSEERYIQMEIKSHLSMLHLIIRNSIEGEVSLITSKRDKAMHGYGLYNLSECIEKNFGQLNIYVENREFVVDILVVAY